MSTVFPRRRVALTSADAEMRPNFPIIDSFALSLAWLSGGEEWGDPEMITHTVGGHLTAPAAEQPDIERWSARRSPKRIMGRTNNSKDVTPQKATRGTAGTLPGLVLNAGKWLLPLLCVFMVSASIGYAMNIAALDLATGTASEKGASPGSITPELQDAPEVGLDGFGLTPSVQRLPYMGLGIEPEQDPQTPAQLQAAAQRA